MCQCPFMTRKTKYTGRKEKSPVGKQYLKDAPRILITQLWYSESMTCARYAIFILKLKKRTKPKSFANFNLITPFGNKITTEMIVQQGSFVCLHHEIPLRLIHIGIIVLSNESN